MSHIENYWRSGYTVEGGQPVEVEKYGRNFGDAEKSAIESAQSAADQLRNHGVTTAVTAWVEQWTLVTTRKITTQPKATVKTWEKPRLGGAWP